MKLSAALALLALLPAKAAAAESSPDTLALLHEVEALRAELAQMREHDESRRLTGSVSEAAFNASIAEARDLSLRCSRVCVCRCVDS